MQILCHSWEIQPVRSRLGGLQSESKGPLSPTASHAFGSSEGRPSRSAKELAKIRTSAPSILTDPPETPNKSNPSVRLRAEGLRFLEIQASGDKVSAECHSCCRSRIRRA
jgi:hypothetical protein